jgi:hypothetical protein
MGFIWQIEIIIYHLFDAFPCLLYSIYYPLNVLFHIDADGNCERPG